ncbi:MAG: ABC transporter permease [Candidatus Heimdallarchaeota archaeon]
MNTTEVKEPKIKDPRVLQLQDSLSRGLSQIGATTKFEFIRNRMLLLIASGVSAVLYVLFLIIGLIRENRGAEYTAEIPYIQSYLGMTNIVVIVLAIIFAGSIIAEDYQKDTGNLIFPKTTKSRLLTGRIIARYLYMAISITVFYLLVGITTLIKFDWLITEFFASWGWALLYCLVIFLFVTMLSSMLRNNTLTIILSIVSLLIVFNSINQILVITGSAIEPFFILTYYGSIITGILDMPDERYAERPLRPGGEGGEVTYSWSTPSATGAAVGMVVSIGIFLTVSFVVFRFRQKK